MSKKQKREYYMAVIKSNLGWRVKDFKGMTFEEIEAKFAKVLKQVEDFIPMGSKGEAERLKRKGLNLEKEQVKKQKSSEEAPEIETTTKEFTEDKIKEIILLVPVEDVYVQALQIKHPIIDWKVHSEGERIYWKIIRLGGSSACYQFFVDLLRQLDREDLNQLWALVKDYLSIRPASSDKEMELWKREYYMAVIKSNLGWRFKDFKGKTFEEIEAKFAQVWKQEEAERLKRKGINLEKEQVKKQKSLEEAPETKTSTEEFTEDKIKEIMQLVLVEDVYVQALQVKHPIIDWKVHSEGEKSYWQIIRLGGSSACYQFFIDLLRQLDREDLNQLWALVKEYLSIRPALKKDYPLRRGLALVMISYRLQVENHSQMVEDLIKKIYNIANTPMKQSD
nr:hypothetical protein [Tanacetum cinerariifolium]